MLGPAPRPFWTITTLTRLGYGPYHDFRPMSMTKLSALQSLQRTLDSNRNTLHRLEIMDTMLKELPMRSLHPLTELTILSSGLFDAEVTVVGLPMFLRHASQLQELCFGYAGHTLDVFVDIQDDENVMPNLCTLSIVWEGFTLGDEDDELTRKQYDALYLFLQRRARTLKQLRLDFGYGEWSMIRPGLEGLTKLSSLEVLGLSLPSYLTDHVELFQVLSNILSDRLFAFSLLVTWDPASLHTDEILPMVPYFSHHSRRILNWWIYPIDDSFIQTSPLDLPPHRTLPRHYLSLPARRPRTGYATSLRPRPRRAARMGH